MRRKALRRLNWALLALYPVAWAAPLLRAGLLPFFDLEAISVLSGLQALWGEDWFLAGLVALFALVAPLAKGYAMDRALAGAPLAPWAGFLGRFAMADIFLVALYVVLAKGVGLGRVEIGWGLYLFSFCVVASLFLSVLVAREGASGGGI